MKIFNSLTKHKQDFVPLTPNKIKMYVCGQTVYDYCHLGHGRKAIVFDMIRRWFMASGYQVMFVENITDIDDKIIKRAEENGESITSLTERYINYMHQDFARLGILRPDVEPKATEYINEMLAIIQGLIDKGYAYQAANGDIYYRVHKFANYGQLSGKSVVDLRSGERVEVELAKEDPLDFVLWKSAKADEPAWDSTFGPGRPGWHIECSAMSAKILGPHFDIHGGGQDLQFPHHENEIAQSEAHNGCQLANYWLHNGFLNVNDEKMSKSLGNFFTLGEVLDQYPPEVIRFYMLKTHYRGPLNFSHDGIVETKNSLTRIYQALRVYSELVSTTSNVFTLAELNDPANDYVQRFKAAMDDDFNTPLAISVLFEIVNELNKTPNLALAQLLVQLGQTIGLITSNPQQFLQAGTDLDSKQIEELIAKRNLARSQKDFNLSDQIRNQLLDNGILLEDGKNGTIWRKV